MAKICVNCDKKIGVFSDEPFEFDNVVLCYDCANAISDDLNDLYYLENRKKFYELSDKIIRKSKELYSEEVVDSIEKKIELIYNKVKTRLRDDIPEKIAVSVANGNDKPTISSNNYKNQKCIKIYTFTLTNVTAIKTIAVSATYGIGLLTSIVLAFCNLFGMKCNMYTDKLGRAEREATKQLIEQAKRLDADGVMDAHCQVDNLTFLIYGTAYKENHEH